MGQRMKKQREALDLVERHIAHRAGKKRKEKKYVPRICKPRFQKKVRVGREKKK